ncbi:hypothetical protein [Dyadobacter tibetensis]|uniref:hypothetical protein n=1 Tax=Dyadobacter tibetensis TaxID=1211851 RepID=UPI000472E8D4|nr:hypothetical protein [Dyadobacter tibetensis]
MKKQLPTRPYVILLRLSFSIALAATLWSCEKENTAPIDHYAYYPLEIGSSQTYQVDETIYSAGQKDPVIKTWQEKDEVNRITERTEFTTTYIVSRYQRNTPNDYWQKVKEFAITKSPDKLLTNLDNQTIVSLVFPVDPNLRWNGNLYNNQDERKYRYESIHQPLTLGELSFDNSLTVVERRDSSFINKYVGVKKYALGVGLVSDEQINIEYCQDTDCIGDYIIESGSLKTRTILSYSDGK